MDIIATLTESQARALFPAAMAALDGTPGEKPENVKYAIVKIGLDTRLATWEDSPLRVYETEGVLYWDPIVQQWDI